MGTAAPISYAILVPTVYGQMLINRHDINQANALIKTCKGHDHHEIEMIARIFDILAAPFGVFIDVGANIGTHTLGIARHLGRGGRVYSYEPQRLLFQMICGSLALNAVTNVFCMNEAAGAAPGKIAVPQFDYFSPMNFGSVEFGPQQREKLDQIRGDDPAKAEFVRVSTIDHLELAEVHVIKIDAEGMELDVLAGAQETIARCTPILLVEYLKVDRKLLLAVLKCAGYQVYQFDINVLAIPKVYEARVLTNRPRL
ncbi:FkbM family methyltransferase [Acidisoma sp.]|uniref:FkbM family methyltransferase n=1 Tax=Acidisoma sp. TaxID=1872115 RepID=UPI003B00B4F9